MGSDFVKNHCQLHYRGGVGGLGKQTSFARLKSVDDGASTSGPEKSRAALNLQIRLFGAPSPSNSNLKAQKLPNSPQATKRCVSPDPTGSVADWKQPWLRANGEACHAIKLVECSKFTLWA